MFAQPGGRILAGWIRTKDFYEEYKVQVCSVVRESGFDGKR
ncbi:MAG TPA: hypothetical protein VN782_05325 [Usitatibacter sp.]|nr:hypothetical protein [Usitatibacter sp.]